MCYFNLMPLYNTRNIMNNSTRLLDYLLSVSLGFDTCLLSYPHSFCQSFPARQRACTLSLCSVLGMPLAPLCHKEEGHPPAAAQRFTLTLHGLTKVRGAKHTREARRDNDGTFSGLVYSKSQETTKKSPPCPSHIPASG